MTDNYEDLDYPFKIIPFYRNIRIFGYQEKPRTSISLTTYSVFDIGWNSLCPLDLFNSIY